MSLAEIRDLSAGYGERKIVKNLSFSLEAGEICGILGANGCGKTTLLKAVCGILPHTGQCRVEDRVLEGLTPKKIGQLCGYIPQRSGISIDISVLDVVLTLHQLLLLNQLLSLNLQQQLQMLLHHRTF